MKFISNKVAGFFPASSFKDKLFYMNFDLDLFYFY